MAESNDICGHCGAPRVPGFAACKFCKTVFPKAAQTSLQDNAVPCPRCQTLNEWGAQRCVQCQTWVVVQCVFCNAISPHHIPACLHCQEPFAGAPERLAQRKAEQASRDRLEVMGSVGSVAASFLGAIAGSALSGGVSHGHHHRRESWSSAEEGWGSSQGSIEDAGGEGGGLLDALSGGSDASDSSSSDSSSWDAGDAGGDGGGLMDELMGGSESDD